MPSAAAEKIVAEPKTGEELEAEWWQAWRDEDYSWNGLADPAKHIGGDGGLHGERSLQDYWRCDADGNRRDDSALGAAGEIERHDGVLWHIAHIPLHWPDSRPAKAAWSTAKREKLAALIATRVAAARETAVQSASFAEEEIAGRDGRSQLQGCVLLDPPDHPDRRDAVLHLVAWRCRVPDWDAAARCFGPGANFTDANFSGDICFNRATFSGFTNFANASFSGHASFDDATFSGDVRLYRATFCGYTRFDGATFRRHVSFTSASFLDAASFTGAVFAQAVRLNGVTFAGYASFESVCFSGDAGFDTATFSGDADLISATFSGNASFISATFARGADFKGATLSSYADFNDATFSGDSGFGGANFLGTADFLSATFSSYADFHSATFSGVAWFHRATFSGYANFISATFSGNANFYGATFKQVADFGRSRFEIIPEDQSVKSGRMSFQQSVFEGAALFADATFAAHAPHHSAAFLGARFKDIANFRRCGDRWIAALDEAEIEKRLLIDDPDEASANAGFATAILPAAIAGGKNDETGETLLKELEGGCRTVKVAMARAKDAAMEQRYYRFELIARRHQAGTPWPERWASRLYGVTSDYGLSLNRPLIGLGVVVALFALLFAGFRMAVVARWLTLDEVGGAVAMSFSRVFPFGAFDMVSKGWIEKAVLIGNGLQKQSGWELVARGLATLESLLAVILIFLFGLALRRRFQIG